MTIPPESTATAIGVGIFPVTDRILLGRFLTPDRAKLLPGLDVTHVLNVSDAPSVVSAADAGVREIIDLPIEDLRQLSVEVIEDALAAIHRILHENEGMVLVHCTACQNRSPTIVWLYLIACGIKPDQAAAMITSVVKDAVPGHSLLVSSELVEWAQQFGNCGFVQPPLSTEDANAANGNFGSRFYQRLKELKTKNDDADRFISPRLTYEIIQRLKSSNRQQALETFLGADYKFLWRRRPEFLAGLEDPPPELVAELLADFAVEYRQRVRRWTGPLWAIVLIAIITFPVWFWILLTDW